jgi:DNA-binding MarR family transcriptional regulator
VTLRSKIILGSKLNLDNYLPFLINRVGSALVARFTAEALVRRGMTIDTWRVLAALSNDGKQRQVDLASSTSIDSSTLSRLITRMVRDGLVTRTRSAKNSREVLIELAPQGEVLIGLLVPVAQDLEKAAREGIDADDLTAAKRVLRQMHKNLTKDG